MSTPLRDRVEHAAKYGANLVVPAREIKQLLDERDAALTAGADLLESHTCGEQAERSYRRAARAEAALQRLRDLHLANTDGDCATCTRGRVYPIPAPCPTVEAAALAEGGEER